MDKEIELFVPGRVCLLGEHSDWAGSFRRFNSSLRPGRTVVVGTNSGMHARVRAHPSSLVLTTTTDKGEVLSEVRGGCRRWGGGVRRRRRGGGCVRGAGNALIARVSDSTQPSPRRSSP